MLDVFFFYARPIPCWKGIIAWFGEMFGSRIKVHHWIWIGWPSLERQTIFGSNLGNKGDISIFCRNLNWKIVLDLRTSGEKNVEIRKGISITEVDFFKRTIQHFTQLYVCVVLFFVFDVFMFHGGFTKQKFNVVGSVGYQKLTTLREWMMSPYFQKDCVLSLQVYSTNPNIWSNNSDLTPKGS